MALPNLVFAHGGRAWSDRGAVLFTDFVSNLPRQAPREETDDTKARPRTRGRFSEEVLRLYPWLRQYTGGSADGHEGGKKTPPGAEEYAAVVDAEHVAVEALDDETAARLFEELEAKRDEALDRAGESRDFTTEIRGGRWTMEHRGVAADSERAKAANKDAEKWCRS